MTLAVKRSPWRSKCLGCECKLHGAYSPTDFSDSHLKSNTRMTLLNTTLPLGQSARLIFLVRYLNVAGMLRNIGY